MVLDPWRGESILTAAATLQWLAQQLERLDPLWEELFPAEQARIIHLLVDRVDIGPGGADVRLKLEGLPGLMEPFPVEWGRQDRRATLAGPVKSWL